MNDHIFGYPRGIKLHRYLENNNTLNLYLSLKEAIDKTRLFQGSDVLSCMKSQYIENNDSLNLYPFPKIYNDNIRLLYENNITLYLNNQLAAHDICGMCGTMNIQFNIRDECLFSFYSLIYDLNLSFMINEIINTIVENEDIMDIEYIIIFLLAVKNDDYTSIDMILSIDFDMNIIGRHRQHMTRDNIITRPYTMSENENMIRYLISNGGDINNENCNIGEYACSKGDVSLFNYLLDLDINDDKLFLMFISSIGNKNFTMTDKIINCGFNMEDRYEKILDNHQCYTYPESVKYLIHCGLDINKYGSRLLLSACVQYNYKLLDFYLKNNLIPDKKVVNTVFENSELNIIETFARNYTDLSAVKFGYTKYDALMASLKNNSLDMTLFLKYLLQNVFNSFINKKMNLYLSLLINESTKINSNSLQI